MQKFRFRFIDFFNVCHTMPLTFFNVCHTMPLTFFYVCPTMLSTFVFPNVQKVGLFLLKRVESVYISRYGVSSVEHGDSDSLFSNLVTSVAEIKTESVSSLEMSSVASTGVSGSFQTFQDTLGMQ